MNLGIRTIVLTTMCAALVAVSGCGTDEPAPSPFDEELAAVVESGIPGVGVRIDDGSGAKFYARGEAEIEDATPIEQANHFRVASVSKAFNGVVMLSLVERGEIKLSDQAGKWLADVLPNARDVTIAQMLQHTGGIPDYTTVPEFGETLREDSQQVIAPKDLLGYVEDLPLLFEPGTEYSYSDSDNIALGLIAEEVTGRTYDELLKELVLEKSGASGTSLPQDAKMPEPFTSGYQLIPGVEKTGEPENVTAELNPALAWASGGIVSTVDDLAGLIQSIADGSFYSDKMVERQRDGVEGQSSPPGPGENTAGLALFGYETKCGTFWGHTGSFPGYRVFVASNAEGTKSAVVYVNATETTTEAAEAVLELQQAALCEIGVERPTGATGPPTD